MTINKPLKISAAVAVILLIGYYYALEFGKNWASLQDFKLVVNAGYLIISLSLFLLSFLLETYIWKVCMNRHLERQELNFAQSVAVVNASGLLKYLPGRIWTYAAQLSWLQKYNIPKSLILYVGLVCVLGSVIVSLYLGFVYLVFYTTAMGFSLMMLCLLVLILINVIYIGWNSFFINKLIALAGRLLKKEIQPLKSSKALLLYIQFIYLCSWFFAGVSGYFLAEGIGLHVRPSELVAILASMSLSWVAGYLAVITPGGLGVREGMMLLMLNSTVNTQTALIFPILSRLMYLVSEALLGAAALALGMKYDVFSSKKGQRI